MVDSSNSLPPKVYRNLLSSIYKQTQKDAKLIKDNFSKKTNPICPKESRSRCLSAKTRNYNLTQEYNKKMEEKPEKLHKRIFPIKRNFDLSLSVISPEPVNRSIKLYKNKRKNQSSLSAPKIERHKKLISLKDNYKNFYLDNFNCDKLNQNDLDKRRLVRNIFLFNIYFICFSQIKYKNRPKDENYINGTTDYKIILEDTHGFKRPVHDTKESIFPENNPKISIKVNRNENLKRKKVYSKAYGDKIGSIISQKDNDTMIKKNNSKTCNSNYKLIYKAARKNAGVRYYFERNTSQFELI